MIAALDVATGKVTAGVVARNDSVHVIEFLDQTAQPFNWVYDAKKPA